MNNDRYPITGVPPVRLPGMKFERWTPYRHHQANLAAGRARIREIHDACRRNAAGRL